MKAYSIIQRAMHLGFLARDFAATRVLRSEAAQERARQRVCDRLGLMHGLPQKIGQLLAFSDIESASPTYGRLSESESLMESGEALQAIEQALGSPWEESFDWVDPQGVSASIGQVHRARTRAGKEYAIKIQLPGISQKISCDLKALGWLTAPLGSMRRGFDIASFRGEIGASLQLELDYEAEARALDEFNRYLKASDSAAIARVRAPVVDWELTRPNLLATTWLEGEDIRAAMDWSEPDRAQVADTMLELFLRGIFQWGFLHADPNPGNYRFSRSQGEARVGLLDFGCVKRVDGSFQAGLCRAIHLGLKAQDDLDALLPAFYEMGFDAVALKPMEACLPAVSRLIAEPFAEECPFEVADWRLGDRLKSILGEHRMAFRMAGPPSLLFVLRSFQGLLHYLGTLGVALEWRSRFIEISKDVSPSSSDLVDESGAQLAYPMNSNALIIRVEEGGRTKVQLSFGAAAVDNLETLVPVEMKTQIETRGIDLKALSSAARESGYAPGELFSLDEGRKRIRVWLS